METEGWSLLFHQDQISTPSEQQTSTTSACEALNVVGHSDHWGSSLYLALSSRTRQEFMNLRNPEHMNATLLYEWLLDSQPMARNPVGRHAKVAEHRYKYHIPFMDIQM